jgi:aryl-alcohol dehydrogenase-like predicted oxidoreductase
MLEFFTKHLKQWIFHVSEDIMSSMIFKKFEKVPFAFGGASISGEGGGYGFGEISHENALSLLRHAYDRDLRIFDTAPIYGYGLSEKRIGAAFKSIREKVFIVSKSGVDWHDNKRVNMTNDPKVTQRMLEDSLRRLDSDYIDLYMIHWPDKSIDIRKPLEILAKAKSQGRIKHIGLCNTFVEDIEKTSEIEKIEAVQSELSFIARDNLKLLSYLAEKKIGFMSWGTLTKGIITGRVHEKRKFDPSDCRSWAPWWKNSNLPEKYELMKTLTPWLKEKNISGVELALGFNFSKITDGVVLCGARSFAQWDSLLDAFHKLPSKELIDEASHLCHCSDI